MSDYAKTTNFTAKDALSTGDPAKLIKGSLFDTEFDAIAVASATKFDTGNLASQAQAEAGTDNTVLMTPLRTEQWSAVWAAENAGIVGDLQALADPGGDRILFWDDSDNATEFLTIGAGLTLTINDLAVNQSSSTVQGKVELATNAEVNTGSDTARAVTPAGLVQCTNLLQATATQRGAAEIATQAEVNAGSDTARYITPATLAANIVVAAITAKVLKTADETISSDNALSVDAVLKDLTMLTGSAFYELEAVLRMTSDPTPDFKFRFVWSQTPTEVGLQSVNSNITSGHNVDGTNQPLQEFTHTVSSTDVNTIVVRGTFKTGATPGTISLEWAQNVSDAANTTVHAGSFMRITKLT